MSKKSQDKLNKHGISNLSEFKLSAELAQERRREREKKSSEKNKSLTSLDLSKAFCENINKLSESPNSIKLTDFGKKCAASANLLPKAPSPKKNKLACNAIFSNGTSSSSISVNKNEDKSSKSKLINKRLNHLKNDFKLPASMITSPSFMNVSKTKTKRSLSPSCEIFTDASEKKKVKTDDMKLTQMENSSESNEKAKEVKKSNSKDSDSDKEQAIDIDENLIEVQNTPQKKIEDEIPPFQPVELKIPEFNHEWLKRLEQEQSNFQKVIDSMKNINKRIIEFRQALCESISSSEFTSPD